MNTVAWIIAGIVAAAVVVLLFLRNQKDKKDLVNTLNNDYRKPKEDEADVESEDVVK
ncbi:MAG: hypothetical protein ABL876_04610 [Chitinophagaceae bacterium]